jgi:MFS family permease
MNQPTPLTFREVLRLKPVRRLWLAQIVSVFGDFLVLFGVISVVSFKFHGSPAQVSLIGVAFMIPFAFIGPLAGVFVDRWNVKRTMIASDLIRALLALSLVFASGLHQLYAILFVLSFVSTFFVPAQTGRTAHHRATGRIDGGECADVAGVSTRAHHQPRARRADGGQAGRAFVLLRGRRELSLLRCDDCHNRDCARAEEV